jgi:hypothetical protein
MTKYTTPSAKASQKSSSSHKSGDAVGSRAVTQTPPTYGIDLADSAPVQKIPLSTKLSAGRNY